MTGWVGSAGAAMAPWRKARAEPRVTREKAAFMVKMSIYKVYIRKGVLERGGGFWGMLKRRRMAVGLRLAGERRKDERHEEVGSPLFIQDCFN
jgi:hypothetical protein